MRAESVPLCNVQQISLTGAEMSVGFHRGEILLLPIHFLFSYLTPILDAGFLNRRSDGLELTP